MKLVFCGTPAFAVPTLEAVLAAGHYVALAVTQPDRPAGRSAQLVAPAVKTAALAHGIPVVQPGKIKHAADFRAQLEAIAADAILIVAYGRIIPKWMLDLPRYGNLNLHGSLLPRYRGAAPIQWAIARGETETGVTTMRIDEGLDTGEVLLQHRLSIDPNVTADELFPLLAEAGAPLMVETLRGLEAGSLLPRPQNEAEATFAPILNREDALVDFSRSAAEIYNRWRGFQPWPGAYTLLGQKKLTLHQIRPAGIPAQIPVQIPSPIEDPSGTILLREHRCFVSCGDHRGLELLEVQLEGKKRMPIADFLRGAGWQSGDRLG